MPPQLRDTSPNSSNLSSSFSLINTTSNIPANALPQRENFVTTTTNNNNNNTTQPFCVNQRDQNNQKQGQRQTTTASYRRRERRNRQQQYRQNNINNNRFVIFAEDANDDNDQINTESNVSNEPIPITINNNKKNQKQNINNNKKKNRLYLQSNRIFKWLNDDITLKELIGSRGNQAYILASTSVYDEWVRTNYELQVWQMYLQLGIENKHWAKEVVQRTKKRDDIENSRFIKKKINQLSSKIAQLSATIYELQIQLGTYWTQVPIGKKTNTNTNQNIATSTTTTPITTTASTITTTDNTSSVGTINTGRVRNEIDKLEKSILNYIQHCTQHVKKLAESRVQLSKAQMEEFKPLEDFEQLATPAQWNVHLILKPKMKTWSIKNKNRCIALKRVEYDLPPKFISKIDFTFKLDEAIIGPEEAQEAYNQMRQITKNYRVQAMTLYEQSIVREYELLSNEIKRIIEGFPQESGDGIDSEVQMEAFKNYHELRKKRLNLETDQSIYFLAEQRVEGESNNQDEEEIIAPTLVRSLGEVFSLQK